MKIHAYDATKNILTAHQDNGLNLLVAFLRLL